MVRELNKIMPIRHKKSAWPKIAVLVLLYGVDLKVIWIHGETILSLQPPKFKTQLKTSSISTVNEKREAESN